MIDSRQNITLNDVQLADAYYPILVDFALKKETLTYGQLVEIAKVSYPGNAAVEAAIPVSTGRKLEVIRIFTNERELPDLTSLVVRRQTGECGDAFLSAFDPHAARARVFNHDWAGLKANFEKYMSDTKKKLIPRKRLTRDAAKELMRAYYIENKAGLPKNIKDAREFIIDRLMDGLPVADVFAEAGREISTGLQVI